MELNQIYNGDCLELMQQIQDKSVDMVLCDLPYGTTACKWDSIIPFTALWEQYERIIKDNAAIVLTASQPFASDLIQSNRKLFKYEWIWEKPNGSNFIAVQYQPFKTHEQILIFGKMPVTFSKSGNMKYYPQKTKGKAYTAITGNSERRSVHRSGSDMGGHKTINEGFRMPRSIQKFNQEKGLHPTQKPVALFEYLIKTYTNEGETVLDNCIGSGTTAIAALNTSRAFIGIEKDETYYKIACERVKKWREEQSLNLFPINKIV